MTHSQFISDLYHDYMMENYDEEDARLQAEERDRMFHEAPDPFEGMTPEQIHQYYEEEQRALDELEQDLMRDEQIERNTFEQMHPDL